MSESYSPNLAQHNLDSVDPEQEYRQGLLNDIVSESAGGVGIHTSMDPSDEARSVMEAAMAERTGRTIGLGRGRGSGGGKDWGERQGIGASSDPMMRAVGIHGQTGENLAFMALPDGTIDVRYSFKSWDYMDDSGRPNNTLMMGFRLTADTAVKLRVGVAEDPTFIRDVIKAHGMAIGISETDWDRKRAPRYTRFDRTIYPAGTALSVIELEPDGSIASQEDIPFADRRPIRPLGTSVAHEQPEQPEKYAQPAAVEEATGVIASETFNEDELTRLHEEDVRQHIHSLEQFSSEEGISPEVYLMDSLNSLASNVTFHSNRLRAAEESANELEVRNNRSGRDVNTRIYHEKFQAALYGVPDWLAFMNQYAGSVMDRYVEDAINDGIPLEFISDFSDVTHPEPNSVLDRAVTELTLMRDSISQSFSTRNGYAAEVMAKAFEAAKQRAAS